MLSHTSLSPLMAPCWPQDKVLTPQQGLTRASKVGPTFIHHMQWNEAWERGASSWEGFLRSRDRQADAEASSAGLWASLGPAAGLQNFLPWFMNFSVSGFSHLSGFRRGRGGGSVGQELNEPLEVKWEQFCARSTQEMFVLILGKSKGKLVQILWALKGRWRS